MPVFISDVCLGRLTSTRCKQDLRDPKVQSTHGFCERCYYPGIEEEYELYKQYREEGRSQHESSVLVGWSDPN